VDEMEETRNAYRTLMVKPLKSYAWKTEEEMGG
jgi:hypothetical protein